MKPFERTKSRCIWGLGGVGQQRVGKGRLHFHQLCIYIPWTLCQMHLMPIQSSLKIFKAPQNIHIMVLLCCVQSAGPNVFFSRIMLLKNLFPVHCFNSILKHFMSCKLGAGEMDQWLRVMTVPPEILSSIYSPQPHGGSQPSIMESDVLFWCV